MSLEVVQLPALSDNYMYFLRDEATGTNGVVDPSEAGPVLRHLASTELSLNFIMNTHHHHDHVGGNLELKSQTDAKVVGFAGDAHRIPGIDVELNEGDIFSLGESRAEVLFIPGHTLGHIAFHFREDKALFCGDTLFAMGCGRLFEGNPKMMWETLNKFKSLAPGCRVFCGHEYTENNAEFALGVDGDNEKLKKRQARVKELRAQGRPTVPSTLAEEFATNPFLRADEPSLKEFMKMSDETDLSVFTEIRKRKDQF